MLMEAVWRKINLPVSGTGFNLGIGIIGGIPVAFVIALQVLGIPLGMSWVELAQFVGMLIGGAILLDRRMTRFESKIKEAVTELKADTAKQIMEHEHRMHYKRGA
jgi:hypothetical protein